LVFIFLHITDSASRRELGIGMPLLLLLRHRVYISCSVDFSSGEIKTPKKTWAFLFGVLPIPPPGVSRALRASTVTVSSRSK
jgi:hypothetical protein